MNIFQIRESPEQYQWFDLPLGEVAAESLGSGAENM